MTITLGRRLDGSFGFIRKRNGLVADVDLPDGARVELQGLPSRMCVCSNSDTAMATVVQHGTMQLLRFDELPGSEFFLSAIGVAVTVIAEAWAAE